eukprot:6195151-Pleurochrysis_carterae.AAC.1
MEWGGICFSLQGNACREPKGSRAFAHAVIIMATDLSANPSALCTRWRLLPKPVTKPKPAASVAGSSSHGGRSGSARGARGGRGRGGGSGRGRAAFAEAFSGFNSCSEDQPDEVEETPSLAAASAPTSTAAMAGNGSNMHTSTTQIVPSFDRTPTQLELACDPLDLKAIRDAYPAAHADLIINTLLSFDGLLSLWFRVNASIAFMAPEAERVARALGTCRKVPRAQMAWATSLPLASAHLICRRQRRDEAHCHEERAEARQILGRHAVGPQTGRRSRGSANAFCSQMLSEHACHANSPFSVSRANSPQD